MQPQAYANMRAVEDQHWWFVGRRAVLRKVLRSTFGERRLSILEAGCGTGGNLGLLAEFGDVHAFEPDPDAREAAASLNLAEVRAGALPGPTAFDERFDLVCALDVIEHVDADEASCAALAQRLKPDGFALFTVPAFMFLWSGHDEVLHHKRRYRRPAFDAMLERAGLEIAYSSYFNTLLFPAALAGRTVQRLTGSASSEDTSSLPPAFANAALGAVFAAERHLLPAMKLPFGVSVLSLARLKR